MIFLAKENVGINILWLVIIFAVSVAVVFLLFRSVKRERIKYLENSGQGNILTKEQMDDFLTGKISGANNKLEFVVIQIDIIDLPSIKKSFGEVQFASVLKEFMNKIFGLVSVGGKISHYDDSIMVYYKQKADFDELSNICKLMLVEAAKPIVLSQTLNVDLGVNIGIASFPTGGATLLELKQNLELALISAKRTGINTCKIYSQDLKNRKTEEFKFYNEIKEAMDKKEFIFFYQPIVNLDTLEVYGAEGLIRWNHSTQGVLPPSKFLHIMEQTGDINWVGFWSFEQMVKQFITWKKNYPDQNLYMSMNLSAKQLINPQLVEEIRRIIKKYKSTTSNFIMEIIEFDLFDKLDVVSDNILKLKQMGFSIAIDNYGLEFSTLSLLEKLPIDIIKLNKDFIRKTKDSSMTLGIVQMLVRHAKDKDLLIMAEGVEDAEAIEYVKSLDIHIGQGYAFSKPKDSTEFMSDMLLTPWKYLD